MADDLGTAAGEVHARAREILVFWFALTTEQQFARDPELDRSIADRFTGWRDEVLAGKARGWRSDPDALLAAIVLVDQFSRNLHRGTAQAFAGDALALELTRLALTRDWEDAYPPERRVFLYMPLMHAEDAATQALSVERFERLGNPLNLDFARQHRDVIARYGRFPSRNAALGRASTSAEREYLSRPDAGW